MTKSNPDPVYARLAGLPAAAPAPALSAELRAVAHARLCARGVHPVWTLLVAASVIGYLSWAVHFANSLY